MLLYKNGILSCEGVQLPDIAVQVGTPVYLYSKDEIIRRARAFRAAAGDGALVSYAVKANGNPAIMRLLRDEGLGADVTSGGELFLALQAGITPDHIIFSGVGKRADEIEMAVAADIAAVHLESEMELDVVASVAEKLKKSARVSVRVNPDIGAETHPYDSTGRLSHKFGVPRDLAMALLRRADTDPWLEPAGIAAHIGSQITDLKPYRELVDFLVQMAGDLAADGVDLSYIDVGGGLGIDYQEDNPPPIVDWVSAVAEPVYAAGYRPVMEPGRSIVGPAGALLTSVLYTKEQGGKSFVIADAGQNDLIRPAMYKAHHPIHPVREAAAGEAQTTVEVVGPICETGDFLARERLLPPVQPGDLLVVMQAGAYGFAMSSNYNGRLRVAEVLVDGEGFKVIRRRQEYEHLLDGCD